MNKIYENSDDTSYPNQNFIYLAETTGTDMNNRVIRNINGDKLQDINVALQTGDFSVDNTRTLMEELKRKDSRIRIVEPKHKK